MSLRTPRHDFGPTSSASKYSSSNGVSGGGGAYGSTPRSANPYGTASLMDTPHHDRDPLASSIGAGAGASTPYQDFDFLSHPLYSDPESQDDDGAGNGDHLQFTSLFAQMAQFKDRLDAFVDESQRRIQSAADTHTEIREAYKTATKDVEREAETEKKSQHELWTKIASEREEDAEARRTQSEKDRYAQSLTAQLADVQSELNEIKREFAHRREEKRQVSSKLKEMTKLDVPEREMLESRTGCKISSPSPGLVSFTFTLLDPSHPSEEAFFVFGVTQRAYSVPIVEPPLADSKALDSLLEELNKGRDAFTFVKRMRALLKDRVVSGVRSQRSLQEAIDAAGL